MQIVQHELKNNVQGTVFLKKNLHLNVNLLPLTLLVSLLNILVINLSILQNNFNFNQL